jgi:hypothetical protein
VPPAFDLHRQPDLAPREIPRLASDLLLDCSTSLHLRNREEAKAHGLDRLNRRTSRSPPKPVGFSHFVVLSAMHTREILELAALVTEQGPVLVRSAEEVPEENIAAYWSASRCRLNRWHSELKRATAPIAAPHPVSSASRPPSPLRGVIEEILASEVLTRVWTAVLCAHDRRRDTDLAGSVAQSVLAAHAEARHRVLTLLSGASGLAAEEAMRLDQLRHRTERWTDVLLGQLATLGDVGQFAFEPERTADFAEDLKLEVREDAGRLVCPLLVSAMRAAFRRGLTAVSPNADLNAKIAATIVAYFPPELLDAAGVPQSLWMLRVAQTARVAEGWIDELLLLE